MNKLELAMWVMISESASGNWHVSNKIPQTCKDGI